MWFSLFYSTVTGNLCLSFLVSAYLPGFRLKCIFKSKTIGKRCPQKILKPHAHNHVIIWWMTWHYHQNWWLHMVASYAWNWWYHQSKAISFEVIMCLILEYFMRTTSPYIVYLLLNNKASLEVVSSVIRSVTWSNL